MIELPPKFKQALGNGVRTSLYPLVRIYKGVKIDDPKGNEGTAWEDAEQVNLSIKETNVSGSAYKPLLLSAPSIKSSADIINNKYTISSVSLSISNAPFQGEIFSDDIQTLLNAVVQIYYCANGIDSIEDCLLVYTGTIRRFNQSAESIKLELEDFTQQILSTKIPSSLLGSGGMGYSEENIYSEDIGKPYPMVYGQVDKSPVIKRAVYGSNYGVDNMGELESELTEFNIDKKGRQILGLWEEPNENNYGHSFLTQSHPLIQNGYIKKAGSLSVYENGFIPIPQNFNFGGPADNYLKRWSYYVDGITDSSVEGYNRITIPLDVDELYYFHQAEDIWSASIKFNAAALIRENDLLGIPSRIYRPLNQMVCVNRRNNTGTINTDQNRIYGFTGYDGIGDSSGNGSVSNFSPWDQEGAMNDSGHYDYNWTANNQSWLEPTDCNDNNAPDVTVVTSVDANWSNFFFPVDRLQNGRFDDGVWIIAKNEDGDSGFGYIKLFFKDNIGNFPATPKIVYDAQYHSFKDMETSGRQHMAYPATFFSDESNLDYSGPVATTADALRGYTSNNLSVPNNKQDWVHINYGDQQNDGEAGTEDTVQLINGFQILSGFTNTNDFENFNFGALKVGQWNPGHDDMGYVSAQLFNFYLLQDAVIDQPLNKDFYADVKGRLKEDNETLIRTAPEIMQDILEDEIGYTGEVNIPNDFDLFQDQYKVNNDFTLNEQKEAKEVFEKLFQSSLAIPSFNEKGEFKIIPIHQLEIDNYTEYQANGTQAINSNTIDNQHILKYSFNLTKLEDVKNQVNVKYKKNYASANFDAETGYRFYNTAGDDHYNSYEDQSQENYPDDPTKHYSLEYYGLKSEEAKLDIETEYIRDSISAKRLQKRLLNWYANQHLIVKVDLPVSYMNLQVGDYIHFDELVGGKLAFGYDYTRHYNKNGQVAYKYFFITKISKSLSKINIEGIQVHRGEYGFWESWDQEYGDTGGNDGALDFEVGDYEDTTIEEDFYINLSWASIPPPEVPNDNNINNKPIAIIDTDIIGEFDYKIFISNNPAPFSFGEGTIMPETTEGEHFELTNDYITITENYNTNINNETQGGTLELRSDFSPPQGHRIDGYIELTHPDLNQNATLSFFQTYIADPYDAILGDVNQDGTINILDLVTIVDHILSGGINLTGQALALADMNQDQTIDVLDVVAIMNIILES